MKKLKNIIKLIIFNFIFLHFSVINASNFDTCEFFIKLISDSSVVVKDNYNKIIPYESIRKVLYYEDTIVDYTGIKQYIIIFDTLKCSQIKSILIQNKNRKLYLLGNIDYYDNLTGNFLQTIFYTVEIPRKH